MGRRMRRIGIAVVALSVLLVAGPATAAFADGPDTAGWVDDSGWQGLDEQIHPVAPGTAQVESLESNRLNAGWQGLDEQIHPVAPGTAQADSTESAPSSGGASEGPVFAPVFAVALGLGLAMLIGGMATAAYRRRTRLAHTG